MRCARPLQLEVGNVPDIKEDDINAEQMAEFVVFSYILSAGSYRGEPNFMVAV